MCECENGFSVRFDDEEGGGQGGFVVFIGVCLLECGGSNGMGMLKDVRGVRAHMRCSSGSSNKTRTEGAKWKESACMNEWKDRVVRPYARGECTRNFNRKSG